MKKPNLLWSSFLAILLISGLLALSLAQTEEDVDFPSPFWWEDPSQIPESSDFPFFWQQYPFQIQDQGYEGVDEGQEAHNPWDYSCPVWHDTEWGSVYRTRTKENPYWGSWRPFYLDYFQSQYSMLPSQYSLPGGAWIDTSRNRRYRWASVNSITGEPAGWSEWYYSPLYWKPIYFSVSKWDGTSHVENLISQFWGEAEIRSYSKARLGFQIPPDLQGNIPNIFFVDVTNAYDDNIRYYALNGVTPDEDLGSYLTNGQGKMVFDLGGYLSPGDELPIELTIAGPLKHYVSEEILPTGSRSTWDYDSRHIQFSAPRLPKVDLSVADIKVIQVNEGLPLVAKKDTIVRVDVNLTGDLDKLDDVKVKLEIKDSAGSTIFTDEKVKTVRKKKTYWDDIDITQDMDALMHCEDAFIFYVGRRLTADNYKVIATVDPDKEIIEEPPEGENDNEAIKERTVYSLPKYKLLYIPVFVKGKRPSGAGRSEHERFLIATYPIAKPRFSHSTWFSHPVHGLVSTPSERQDTFKKVEAMGLKFNKLYDPDAHRFIGYVPSGALLPEALGWYWPGTPKAALVDLSATNCALAHELGHSYGLGDEYGEDYTGNQIGDITIYNLDGRAEHLLQYDGPLGWINHHKICFMGKERRSRSWVESSHWTDENKLFYRFRFRPDPPTLMVSGTIYKDDTIHLDPWYPLGDVQASYSRPGDYSVECLGMSGEVLNSFTFPIDWNDPSASDGIAGSCFAVPYPPQTAKVVIKHFSRVLAQRERSLNSPSITITSLQHLPDGVKELSWQANDPDGDTLSYDVYYSWDGGENFAPVETGISQTTISIDTTENLPGGINCLFKVTASDNFNEAEDNSEYFSVPTHSPEVEIVRPHENSEFIQGDRISFSGGGHDLEDEMLTEDSLIWTSSIDGEIGRGSDFSHSQLSLGEHIITLKVQDSEGKIATDSVKIVVTEETAPDVSIRSISFNPERPKVGEEVTITVELFNIRSDALFNIRLYVDSEELDISSPINIEGKKLWDIASNTIETVQAKWTVPGTGAYTVWAIVSDVYPEESDITNNEAEAILIMNRPPVADADGPYEGETDKVLLDIDPDTLNLSNQGRWVTAYLIEDSDGIADIQLDGSDSYDPDGDEITYTWTVTDLDGNEVATATGVSPIASLAPGGYDVTLIVNDGSVDSESDTSTISVYLLDVSTLDPTTLYLNDVQGEWGEFQDPELMLKFGRQLVSETLEVGDEVEMVISGDDIAEASDFITVIDRGTTKAKGREKRGF